MLSFFVKQKTAYDMRISDWSSDVCSSDLRKKLKYPPKRRNIFAPQSFAPHREEKNMSIRKMIGRHPQVQGSVNEALALAVRSEEHTSELQSLMRISYAVFCLKKTKQITSSHIHLQIHHNIYIHNRYRGMHHTI